MTVERKGVFVVGLTCAGKSAFGRIAESLGYPVAEWSRFLRRDLPRSRGTRSDFHRNVAELVARNGPEHYPRKIYESLMRSTNGNHVVVGPRNPRELSFFRHLYTASQVVWISATYQNRFLRSTERKRDDADQTMEEFLSSDFHELAHGLADIAAGQIDAIILNDGAPEAFQVQVAHHLHQFLGETHASAQPL